ncbi:MAG: amidase [SAR324 cluster bacterium]|nr:amidase [SAR324 cluster bacterium]
MNAEDLCFTSATELAEAIRTKALSPVEIAEAVLERIERVNPKLNAYCTLTAEIAREGAKRAEQAVMGGEKLGPLHGVPYSVKDLVITEGIRTMRGSKIHENEIPTEDAPLVTRLKQAGGVMIGKTTTPEFGWKGMTDSPVTGVTRNPWNTDLTPGGSSGGASAQVAAGLAPLAVGTDGGGSIRIPAGFAGIFGIKASYGRVPVYPSGAFDTLSHAGPMTRTVADAALMLSVMAGHHPSDRFSLLDAPADYVGRLREGIGGLRVAWSPNLGYATVNAEVARVSADAAGAFPGLGCTVEEVADPGFGDPTPTFTTHWLAGAAGMLGERLPEWEAKIDPGLVDMVKRGLELSAADFVKAQIERHAYCDRVRRFFESFDLLLTPTLAVLPFKAGVDYTEALKDEDVDWISWTPFSYPFNLTHLPAATVPAGFSQDGLPVGLQIVGRRGEELRVLQAAAAFEEARPWAGKRPPV